MERHAKAHAYNRTRPKGSEHVALQSRNAFSGLNPPAPNSVLEGTANNSATASNFHNGSVKQSVYTVSTFRKTTSEGKSTTTRWEATAFTVEKSTAKLPKPKAITYKNLKGKQGSTPGGPPGKSSADQALTETSSSNKNSTYAPRGQRNTTASTDINEQDFMQHGSFLKLLMQGPFCNPSGDASASSPGKGSWSAMPSRNNGTQDQFTPTHPSTGARHGHLGQGAQINQRSSEGRAP